MKTLAQKPATYTEALAAGYAFRVAYAKLRYRSGRVAQKRMVYVANPQGAIYTCHEGARSWRCNCPHYQRRLNGTLAQCRHGDWACALVADARLREERILMEEAGIFPAPGSEPTREGLWGALPIPVPVDHRPAEYANWIAAEAERDYPEPPEEDGGGEPMLAGGRISRVQFRRDWPEE